MIPPELHIDTGYWYLASPYTRYVEGIDAAAEEVSKVAAQLISAGVQVFCPISHAHFIAKISGLDPLDHKLWMALNQPFMDAAHGLLIVKMPGWKTSQGVGEEISAFKRSGKPISHMEWHATE
jgi:hypothetical protein